jgi:4-hydroxy-tetrahydrodipicolinate synthase
MKSPVPHQGVLAALWTPTGADGEVLRDALATHLDFLKGSGLHGVLALGSTGEFPLLTVRQRRRALELAAELAAPLPVVANISDIRPAAVAELGRAARELGLPAVAIMGPGFYPAAQEDLLEHFLRAAEAADLPVFLYNFPELVGTRIELETVAAFAERAPMAGIKQSGGEFGYHEPLVALGRRHGFVVFTGADTRIPEALAVGAAGCIGGLANVAPELMVRVYRQCRGEEPGDPAEARERLARIGAVVDRLPFPLNVAAGMAARGLPTGEAKAWVSPRSRQRCEGVVAELGRLFGEWDLAAAPAARGRAG